MPDLKISVLPPLTGALLDASDPFPLADLSASETKKITARELATGLAGLFPAGSIPSTAVTLTLSPGSVTTAILANGSVTAAKLADNSSAVVGTPLPVTGSFVGQIAVDTTDNRAKIWTGAIWEDFSGAAAVSTITGGGLLVKIVPTEVNGTVTLDTQLTDTTTAAHFLAGPTGGGGVVAYRGILGTDLPDATATTKGVIQVSGNGLKVTSGVIAINNAVVPSGGTYGVVNYNAEGLVIGGRNIAHGDLPLAAPGLPGAIYPGVDFAIGVGGALNHSNTVIPGAGVKVSYDASGHVTGSSALSPLDIPDLPASKITSGALGTPQIGARSVTEPKLADYSIAYIQDTIPASTGGSHHIGMLWLNPLAQQIRMWDGNVWVPIGVGALSEQNLRFCGLFDASTGKIAVVTKLGLDAGFKAGDTIPITTEQLTGAYFVANTPGSGTAQTTGVTYDNGDWIVSISVAQGWQRVDTLNSAGGGGGATTLDGLVDVTAPSPATGQALIFNGVNWASAALPVATAAAKGIIELATQAEVDAGTDTVRAVTPATLKQYVVDASTTVKGVIQLATAAEVLAGMDALKAVTPKEAKDHYLAKNIALLAALP